MSWKRSVLDKDAQQRVGDVLQGVVVDLIDLALQGKQAHWTVKGPNFRSLHKQLDDMVEVARDATDDLAERLSALGVAPDGCVQTVAHTTRLEAMPVGFHDWRAITDWISDRLAVCSHHLQEAMCELDPIDDVSTNMLQDVAQLIEKQLWMMQAHQGEADDPGQEDFERAAQEETTASHG